jgi:hypothetical protein
VPSCEASQPSVRLHLTELVYRRLASDSVIAPGILPALLNHAKRTAAQLRADGENLDHLLDRVELMPSELCFSISLTSGEGRPVLLKRSVPMSMRRRGVETRLILESGRRPAQIDETLIRAVARARAWLSDICSGAVQSHKQLAEGVA